MSEFNGTKGPWIVRDEEIQSVGTEGSMTAMCYGLDNARLISAAPELLEALQEMVAIVKKHTYPQPDKPSSTWGRMEEAEAVIKKALGQEPQGERNG
ncbi:hypothetical protein N5580_13270 [Pantoea piersonii]|uniref:Uncharacterized protein n=1 Tax=Pantoea piersonii TaxID=2364647 RepID=A0AAJ5QG52_9GAMM|nr:hypothetical protein [Pantoea piersonii]WBG90057.1 hypothetical protein N5580_13270 [Pantoea piersonii]